MKNLIPAIMAMFMLGACATTKVHRDWVTVEYTSYDDGFGDRRVHKDDSRQIMCVCGSGHCTAWDVEDDSLSPEVCARQARESGQHDCLTPTQYVTPEACEEFVQAWDADVNCDDTNGS